MPETVAATLAPAETLTEGLHYRIPMDQYQRDPAPEPSLSSGIVSRILRSPAHAWTGHPRLNPRWQSEEATTFDMGSAAHALLLEPHAGEAIAWIEADDWRTKDAKERRDHARAQGRTPVLARYRRPLEKMVTKAIHFLSSSELHIDLKGGDSEVTMIWQEGEIWCRGRADWIEKGNRLMLDYKTTAGSADPDSFIRNGLAGMGYDVQAAHYMRGLLQLSGEETANFVFLVQENEPPYACSLIALDPSWIDHATQKVERAIELWRKCISANDWPAYPQRVCYAAVPPWHDYRWQERMSLEAMRSEQ